MYVLVGHFYFRSLMQEERGALLQSIEQELTPLIRECRGFRSVEFIRPHDDEMMAIWHWDSEADWNDALARFGPYLQRTMIPNFSRPAERIGGEVIASISG